MDWLKAILKAAGLDDAKIESMIGDVNKELPKHFVPKQQYNDVSDQRKQLEKDVADRDKQIADLGSAAGASEELKAQITKLQADNKTAKDQHEAALKDLRLNTAIDKALTGANAKHTDLLLGKIDKAKLELQEDGTVKGLDDQVKSLQTSYKELFSEDSGAGRPRCRGATPQDGSGGGGGGGGQKDGDFGKRLAEQSKVNEGLAKAQQSYFE